MNAADAAAIARLRARVVAAQAALAAGAGTPAAVAVAEAALRAAETAQQIAAVAAAQRAAAIAASGGVEGAARAAAASASAALVAQLQASGVQLPPEALAAAAAGAGGVGAGAGAGDAAAGGEHYVDELEINDYPPRARMRVLKREFLGALQDGTRTAITSKGVFVEAGRKPPAGERKLYLQIEGPVEGGVRKAKRELHRALEEETLRFAASSASAAAAYGAGSGLYTKFTVQ